MKKKTNKKHISIDVPCTANELEHLLHLISHEGHWHDAIVETQPNKIVITYEDDL